MNRIDDASLPLLIDGGMGRELHRRGVDVPHTIWSAKALFDAPDVVLHIHLDSIAAGANVITTNTYGVIRKKFESIGLGDRVEEMNVVAAEIAAQARRLSGRKVLIAGSLPPLRGSYRPDLVGEIDELLPLYGEQARTLAPHVDFFICETMSHTSEAAAAAAAATSTGLPVWVSFTLDDHHPGHLKSGESIEQARAAIADLPVSGLLANCCKPETITASMAALLATKNPRIGGYANTFDTPPKNWLMAKEGRLGLRADLGPVAYAAHAGRWLDAGATVIGGCCGTTPDHIARLRQLLDST